MSKINAGLVQPVANWSRNMRRFSERMASTQELGGKRYFRLPGQCGVIAPPSRARGPLERYHAATLLYANNLILPSDRVLYCLLAFFHRPPTSPENAQAPALPHRDTSVVTIFPGKGSDFPTNASGSGTARSRRRTSFLVTLSLLLFAFLALFSLCHVVSVFLI